MTATPADQNRTLQALTNALNIFINTLKQAAASPMLVPGWQENYIIVPGMAEAGKDVIAGWSWRVVLEPGEAAACFKVFGKNIQGVC